jgi:hypothetical protein
MKRKSKQVKSKSVKVEPVEVDLSKLMVNGSFDHAGIHITITYQGHHIHYLLLATNEFTQWMTMTPQQKKVLIWARINHSAFGNNQQIVDLVVQTTCNTINRLLPTAQRDRALRFTLP